MLARDFRANRARVWGGSFVPRYALVSQKALVGLAVHQGTAFLTGHAIGGCFDYGDFVFGSAVAFMRSGEPFYEFGHARQLTQDFQLCGLIRPDLGLVVQNSI